MRRLERTMRHKVVGMLCTAGVVFQVGSCDFGEITTTTTLNGRELVITLVRSAILTPIDQFITVAVNELFNFDE